MGEYSSEAIKNADVEGWKPKAYTVKKKHREESPEIDRLGREFFVRYADNFRFYIDRVGTKIYTQKCEELGSRPMYSVVNRFMEGRTHYIQPSHYIQFSYLSKLPMGMLLNANLKFYCDNLMIKLTRGQTEVEIGASYITDGVYLYGKNLANPVPLGTKFQEAIDQSFDTRTYIRK